MTPPLIWLHEAALRETHPVFSAAPPGTKAVFIWDDAYFKQADYSLKRLVFIYETLCDLPVDIIQDETLNYFKRVTPSALFVPCSVNPFVQAITESLSTLITVHRVPDEPFVVLPGQLSVKRFFQYWNKAKTGVFTVNGGINA